MSRRAAALAAVLACATPVAAQDSIRDLVETVDISGLSVSPDGRHVAFRTTRASIADNGFNSAWHVIAINGDYPDRVIGDGGAPLWTDAGVMIDGSAVWDQASRFIYYRALASSAIGIWRAPIDGSGAQLLTHEDADVRWFALNSDGQHISFATGAARAVIARAETQEYDNGILVDRSVDPAQALFRGALVNGRLATQRLTGHWFERAGLLADTPDRMHSLDLITRSTRGLTIPTAQPPRSPGDTALSARSMTGDIARIVAAGGEAIIEIAPTDGSHSIRCRSALCHDRRIVAMTWWPGRDALLVTAEDNAHAQRLAVWDIASGRVRIVADDPGLLGGGRGGETPCAVDIHAAYCIAASPASPPQLVRIDLTTGQRSVLFDPNRPLRSRSGAVVERLDWKDPSGQPFTAQLFRPSAPSPTPLPLFISYYRCDGFIRGGLGDEWPFATLVQAGIIGLCINKPPEPAGGQTADRRYDQALSAVRSAIALLADRKLIDPDRVGMGGLSFGSEAAMWVAVHSNLLHAVSIASVQLEPSYYWFNGVAGRDNHANLAAVWGLGPPDATPARWKQVSPALNVERITAPVLLQLPEQEARLTMELYARLTLSTTPAELYAFPDEPHIKLQPRHKLAANRRNLDWFRFWLQGYTDPDPLKAGQFARWQALARRQPPRANPAPSVQSTPDRKSGSSDHLLAARVP